MTILGAASDYSFAERLAAVRAQYGGTLLVSSVDTPAPIAIGCLVSQRVDPLAAHEPMSGRVVERWCDPETGCQGVTVVERAGETGVRYHRLRLEDCVTTPGLVGPASRSASAKTARGIFAALGASGGALTVKEERLLHWADALLHSVGSTDTVPVPTQGEQA